ncbi:MAG: alpha/beta hydrolase family protein [Pseudomonadota bacterium]
MKKQWILGLLLGMTFSVAGIASEVTATLPNGLRVSADYRPAKGALAVLILHGFLVNGSFPTVQSLANDLSAKGYSVLAPSLSLGVSGRRSGLACDAIHTHTHAGDLSEVRFWIDWLLQQGAHGIVLLGHSFGGVQLLDYLAHAPPQVVGLIGISMSYVGAPGEQLVATELARAKLLHSRGDTSLGRYHLIYCHGNYTSTVESYLSYAALQRSAVLALASNAKLPRIAIMGGGDQRFGADWVKDMQKAGIAVRVAPGASHFFDGAHEFDLLDAVDQALADLHVRP